MSPIDGYSPPTFRFGGLGASPLVARSDIFTASLPGALAGPGVAATAARSDVLTAILTSKGAILLGGAASTVGALAVGTNTQALVADSTQTLGVKWAGDTAWTVPTLNANWSAYGPSPVGYRKDAAGFVHLRGVLINGTGATNPAFTLPAGYRPGGEVYSGACAGNGGSFGAVVAATALVSTNGDVQVDVPAANYYSYLNALIFLAEA